VRCSDKTLAGKRCKREALRDVVFAAIDGGRLVKLAYCYQHSPRLKLEGSRKLTPSKQNRTGR
jgi:hypothetical protein